MPALANSVATGIEDLSLDLLLRGFDAKCVHVRAAAL
jgi:hypothetical protein